MQCQCQTNHLLSSVSAAGVANCDGRDAEETRRWECAEQMHPCTYSPAFVCGYLVLLSCVRTYVKYLLVLGFI